MKSILFCMLIFSFAFFSNAQNNSGYEKGKLIYKLQNSTEKSNGLILNDMVEGEWTATKKFPDHSLIREKSLQKNAVDLSGIYQLEYESAMDPAILAKKLFSTGKFQYVEPVYLPKLTYVPNDTLQHKQYYLNLIEAFKAWNINKGDTNVVIGIVDTGVDVDHADLKGSFHYNYADPINGIDDDNDGYVDNFLGWNTADNTNDVNLGSFGHGVNVAGIASATTDNVTGISGTGFSCQILPVRIDDAVGRLVGAYEGIVYAADHGADIINCSWGGYHSSEYGQDIIDYATSKGVLVVAAVGNDTSERTFFPAGYENVLSVGASEQQDLKKYSSNYGYWVDVFAPGEAMYTLNSIGGYQINGGTSMASPVVAGVAGLVKSHFPLLSPLQIAHKIISTADNIEHLNDVNLKDKIGSGRVNAFRALAENNLPGIEMHAVNLTDKEDDLFNPGDSIFVFASFTNYLSPAGNVSIELTGNNSYFEFVKSTVSLGNLDSMETKENAQDPFILRVKSNIPINELTELKFTIRSGSYRRIQSHKFILAPDYLNVQENLISTTLSSKGRIGYVNAGASEGLGFRFKSDTSHLFEASFMIGNGPNQLADAFRSQGTTANDDFKAVSRIEKQKAKKADHEYHTVFSDANHDNPLGLEITQRNFVFEGSAADNVIFFTYKVKNTSSSEINNLHAGIIADWDILNYATNRVLFDAAQRMGISFSTDSSLFFGIKLLSSQQVKHYAIDNHSNGNGGVNIMDGFSDEEKYIVLSTTRDSAGFASTTGNDILDAVSAGPVNIMPDSTATFGFVMLAAESLPELLQSAENAQLLYDELALSVEEKENPYSADVKVFPNPGKEEVKVKFALEDKQSCKLSVYDSAGKLVFEKNYGELNKSNYEKNIPLKNFRSGVYFLNLMIGNRKIENKFVVIK